MYRPFSRSRVGSSPLTRRGDKKKPAAKRTRPRKPAWDDTVHDLGVYKASPEEIVHRKLSHKSQNIEQVRYDKLRKKIATAKQKERAAAATHVNRSAVAVLREVLYDRDQLQDVLSKSDQAMAVVRDLFGDDPKKYRGLPNVTAAPNVPEEDLDRTLCPGTSSHPSKLDKLSESVMDKTALNEYTYSDEDYEDSDGDEPLEYKTGLDLNRFRQFIETEHQRAQSEEQQHHARLTQSVADKKLRDMMNMKPEEVFAADDLDGSYLGTPTAGGAINDTAKVKRSLPFTTQGKPESDDLKAQIHSKEESVGQISSLDDLRKVLGNLEGSIGEYEKLTGREPSADRLVPNTFSGYTTALVDSVAKLTNYLRESEIRLKAESTLRQQLSENVKQLESLVDALTSDIISTQEEFQQISSEFSKYKYQTSSELHAIKQTLVQNGLHIVAPVAQVPSPAFQVPNHVMNRAPVVIQGTNRVPVTHPQTLQNLPRYTQRSRDLQNQPLGGGRQLSSSVSAQERAPESVTSGFTPMSQISSSAGTMTTSLPTGTGHTSGLDSTGSDMNELVNLMSQAMQMGMNLQGSSEDRMAQRLPQTQGTELTHSEPTSAFTRQPLAQTNFAPPGMVQSHQPHLQATKAPVTRHPLPRPTFSAPATFPQQAAVPLSLPKQADSPRNPDKRTSRAPVASREQIQSAMHTLKAEAADKLRQLTLQQQINQNGGQVSDQSESEATFQNSSQSESVTTRPMVPPPGGGFIPAAMSAPSFRIPATNERSGVIPMAPSMKNFDTDRKKLQQQIEELNKRHQEAQSKLQQFFQQQQPLQSELMQQQLFRHQQKGDSPEKLQTSEELVSPPISPIPLASDQGDVNPQHLQETVELSEAGSARGITVSLPRVEMLESSGAQTPSPGENNPKTVSRVKRGQQKVPIMTVSPGQHQALLRDKMGATGDNDGWFALSTHVS